TPSPNGNLRCFTQSHADILQYLSAFETRNRCRQNIREGDTLWCADDWSASDLLLNLIYPAWWLGNAVVTKSPDGLTAESTLQIFQRCDVTTAFVQGGLLNDLLRVDEQERKKFDLKLRTIVTRSDSLTTAHAQQAKSLLGATLPEIDG